MFIQVKLSFLDTRIKRYQTSLDLWGQTIFYDAYSRPINPIYVLRLHDTVCLDRIFTDIIIYIITDHSVCALYPAFLVFIFKQNISIFFFIILYLIKCVTFVTSVYVYGKLHIFSLLLTYNYFISDVHIRYFGKSSIKVRRAIIF